MKNALLIAAMVGLAAFPSISQAQADQDHSKSTAQNMADSANSFAVDLYSKVRTGDGNLIFSPYSIDTALLMLYSGANGPTADEIGSALHLPKELAGQAAHAAAGELIRDFQASKDRRGYELHVADALWGANGVNWRPEFLQLMKADYLANLQSLDFSDEPTARKTINDWVAQQTADKIKDLIPAGALTKETRLILTNAVYFKGEWLDPFQTSSTQNGPFHANGDEKTVDAQMMHARHQFQYMENDQLQALEMPYAGARNVENATALAGNHLSMLILLPRSNDGLKDLESKLDAKMLANDGPLMSKLEWTEVALSLPKFEMATTLDLNRSLTNLGIRTAFNSHGYGGAGGASPGWGLADFSGMDGSRDLFLSDAIHKAYIKLDESGTEAAAATGMMMHATAMRPQPNITFTADHPFVFVLRDDQTGLILFMGRVNDPRH